MKLWVVPWVSECVLCLAFAASGRGHEDTVEEPGKRGMCFVLSTWKLLVRAVIVADC